MRALYMAATVCLLLAAGGCGSDDGPGGCSKYTGNIGGVQATASCTFEPLQSHTVMTCEITSNPYGYIFAADMIGNRGWADMVEKPTGTRMRVQVDMTGDGFLLTVNPFGHPTYYRFTCS